MKEAFIYFNEQATKMSVGYIKKLIIHEDGWKTFKLPALFIVLHQLLNLKEENCIAYLTFSCMM